MTHIFTLDHDFFPSNTGVFTDVLCVFETAVKSWLQFWCVLLCGRHYDAHLLKGHIQPASLCSLYIGLFPAPPCIFTSSYNPKLMELQLQSYTLNKRAHSSHNTTFIHVQSVGCEAGRPHLHLSFVTVLSYNDFDHTAPSLCCALYNNWLIWWSYCYVSSLQSIQRFRCSVSIGDTSTVEVSDMFPYTTIMNPILTYTL